MIKRIKIQNFKSLQSIDIETSFLNIFIGLNGMGKSSLIQTLLLLRQSYQHGLIDKGLLLNDENLVTIGTAFDAICEDRSSKEISIELSFSDNKIASWNFDYSKVEQDKSSEIIPISKKKLKKNKALQKYSLFGVENFQYLCAERISPKPFFFNNRYTSGTFYDLGKFGQNTPFYLWNSRRDNEEISIKELAHKNAIFYENFDLNKEFPKQLFRLVDNVNAWMGEISPGIQINAEFLEKVGVTTLPISFLRHNAAVSREYRSTNVGFGITYALPVVVSLLRAKKEDLIVIENPESHIHPQGQYNLGQLISLVANSGVQIFVETHSDHLIEGIKSVAKTRGSSDLFIKFFYFEKLVNSSNTVIAEISLQEFDNMYKFEGFYTDVTKCLFDIRSRLKSITKPLVITEGKTDWKHIEVALIKLKNDGYFSDLDIDFYRFEDELNMGDGNLKKLCLELAKIKNERVVVCMFDSDVKEIVKTMSSSHGQNFCDHSNNVFSFCIPSPSHRKNHSGVCIELYYSDDEIMQLDENGYRLFLSHEFNEKSGKHKKNPLLNYGNKNKLKDKCDAINSTIIDADVFNEYNNNIALSKNDFAEHVYSKKTGFDSFGVDEFKNIFSLIQKIIDYSNSKK